jgi:hypothetical protein
MSEIPHVRTLMLWLCEEVERLKKLLNPKPIDKLTILSEKKLRGHLFIEAFTNTFPLLKDPLPEEAKALISAKELTITLLVNGIPLDAGECIDEWEKQVDRMIAERAKELIKDKFAEGTYALDELMGSIKTHIKQKMLDAGIPFDDDDSL